jgi:hypothetical protein
MYILNRKSIAVIKINSAIYLFCNSTAIPYREVQVLAGKSL